LAARNRFAGALANKAHVLAHRIAGSNACEAVLTAANSTQLPMSSSDWKDKSVPTLPWVLRVDRHTDVRSIVLSQFK
jgi:hypothetical protein